MDGNSVKECGVCTHEFDEDKRCPRSLPCFHCICTFCIEQLILKTDTKCPFCRQSFEANSAQDLKINTPVLDLIMYIKTMEANTARDASKSNLDLVDELKMISIETTIRNLTITEEALSDLKTTIDKNKNLKVNSGIRLMKLKNDVKSKIRALEESYDTFMEYLDEENQRLESIVAMAAEKNKECNRVKSLLDEATTKSNILLAANDSETCDSDVKTWITKTREVISTHKKINQWIEKSTRNFEKKMSAINEILKKTGEEVVISELAALTLQDENQRQIRDESMPPLKDCGNRDIRRDEPPRERFNRDRDREDRWGAKEDRVNGWRRVPRDFRCGGDRERGDHDFRQGEERGFGARDRDREFGRVDRDRVRDFGRRDRDRDYEYGRGDRDRDRGFGLGDRDMDV